jgi:predicted nuclease with TOPRIM domain
MQTILTPISPGELIDKLTILEIKAERIRDSAKLANVRHELQLLEDTWRKSGHDQTAIQSQWDELRRINAELWDIEDRIRDEERAQRFEAEFIRLARAVYITNDERARVKREINTKLGSKIVEEKSYAEYR